MAKTGYIAGPSRLQMTGAADLIQPGQSFEHDFSADGPEGEHGPAREAAMIASGAISRAPDAPLADATSATGSQDKE